MKPRANPGWMWADACALVDEAEQLHRRFYRLLARPSAQPSWEPPVNVFRRAGIWSIVVALPGARADQVSIEIHEGGIDITALVAPPAPGFGSGIERLEIPYGRMRRQINLPSGRYAVTERRLELGCLYLQLTEIHR